MQQTLYWYDLETWGLDPKYTSIAQFAGIRTDLDLQVIGEPLMLYAQPRNDVLPEPQAVLTTGITPQQALSEGMVEKDFMAHIYAELIKPGTITTGYNTLRFDDEMLRYALYRNLYDPYEREYSNGNNRWDILDLIRAARTLRPDGLQWPLVDGEPSNRLEVLTKANGLAHDGAHDALVDVRATIELARLLKTAQPELYDYGFSLANKRTVEALLQEALQEQQPLIHTSGKYPNSLLNTSLVAVLGQHPVQKSKFIVYDLRTDPSEFMQLSPDELAARRFVGQDSEETRLPVKEVHVSKAPFLAPMNWFTTAAAARIQLDESVAQANLQKLTPEFQHFICDLYATSDFESPTDVDAQLYDGFADAADKRELERLRSYPISQWGNPQFKDSKYASLAKRYMFRNFADQLPPNQLQQWEAFRADRLTREEAPWMTYPKLASELANLSQTELTAEEKFLLEELKLYAESIYPALT